MNQEEKKQALRALLLIDPEVLAPGPGRVRNGDGSLGDMEPLTETHLAPIKPEFRKVITDSLAAAQAVIDADNAALEEARRALLAAKQDASGLPAPRRDARYGIVSDLGLAAYLNALVPGQIDVPVENIRQPLFVSGDWGYVDLVAAQVVTLDSPLVPIVAACRTVVATLLHAKTVPAADFPALKSAADAMLATGMDIGLGRSIIGANTHASVIAAMDGQLSRLYTLDPALAGAQTGGVTPSEISTALRGP